MGSELASSLGGLTADEETMLVVDAQDGDVGVTILGDAEPTVETE